MIQRIPIIIKVRGVMRKGGGREEEGGVSISCLKAYLSRVNHYSTGFARAQAGPQTYVGSAPVSLIS